MKIDTHDHPVQCSTFQYYFYAIIVSIYIVFFCSICFYFFSLHLDFSVRFSHFMNVCLFLVLWGFYISVSSDEKCWKKPFL